MRIACVVAFIIAGILAGSSAARAEGEPKVDVGGSLTVWFPLDDADDYSDISLGIRPVFTYWVHPVVGLTGTFDYVFVNEESGGDDVTYYAISAGVRLTLPGGMRIKPYGEVLVGWHFLDAPLFDESDIGFRFGGGVTYAVSRALQLHAGIDYSRASLDSTFADITVAAFILDLGVAARF